jgi:hypothetical protein
MSRPPCRQTHSALKPLFQGPKRVGAPPRRETIAVEIYSQGEAVATGTSLGTPFYMPWDATLIDVDASVGDGGTSGNNVFDVNRDGVSALATKITVESGENRSDTAATQPVISTAAWTEGDLIEIDCDSAGTGVTGPAIIYMHFRRK